MIDDKEAIGIEILRHWGPIFAEREVDRDAQELLLDFVQPQQALESWEWPRGQWQEDLIGLHEATPGPDGLPYAFWREGPAEWTSLLDDLGEQLAGGAHPPAWRLASRTACIPRGSTTETPVQWSARPRSCASSH